MTRLNEKYKLNEILFLINGLKSKTFKEIAFQVMRTPSAIRSKFSARPLEDGSTSLRGIKQYKSMEELFKAFGENFIDEKDVQNRIEEFKVYLKERSNVNQRY